MKAQLTKVIQGKMSPYMLLALAALSCLYASIPEGLLTNPRLMEKHIKLEVIPKNHAQVLKTICQKGLYNNYMMKTAFLDEQPDCVKALLEYADEPTLVHCIKFELFGKSNKSSAFDSRLSRRIAILSSAVESSECKKDCRKAMIIRIVKHIISKQGTYSWPNIKNVQGIPMAVYQALQRHQRLDSNGQINLSDVGDHEAVEKAFLKQLFIPQLNLDNVLLLGMNYLIANYHEFPDPLMSVLKENSSHYDMESLLKTAMKSDNLFVFTKLNLTRPVTISYGSISFKHNWQEKYKLALEGNSVNVIRELIIQYNSKLDGRFLTADRLDTPCYYYKSYEGKAILASHCGKDEYLMSILPDLELSAHLFRALIAIAKTNELKTYLESLMVIKIPHI